MDLEQLVKQAHFEVGAIVYVNGLARTTVLARFYRRSTGQIMFQLQGTYGNLEIEQGRLRKERVLTDSFNEASMRSALVGLEGSASLVE